MKEVLRGVGQLSAARPLAAAAHCDALLREALRPPAAWLRAGYVHDVQYCT